MKAILEFDLSNETDAALYQAASQGLVNAGQQAEVGDVAAMDEEDRAKAELEAKAAEEAEAKKKARAEASRKAREKKKAEEDALDDDLDLDGDDEAPAITKEDVRAALKKFAADNSKSDALKILKGAGANSMSELEEKHFAKVIKAIKDFEPAD